MKSFTYIVLILLLVPIGLAGQSCSQKLDQAQRAYFTGNLRDVKTILNDCIGRGKSTLEGIELVEAARLVVLSSIFIKDQRSAEEAMLILLNEDPEYAPTGSDPPEFVRLLQSFDRNPVFSYGLTAGINNGYYDLETQYSLESDPNTPEYSGKFGFQLGLDGVYHLNRNLWITSAMLIEKRVFSVSESLLSNINITSTESQVRFEIPLTIRYLAGKRKLRPYVEAGSSVNFLLSANSLLVRENTSSNIQIVAFDFDMMDHRNTANFKLLFGAGLMYKIFQGYLGFDLRYGIDMKNQVNTEDRFDEELTGVYNYIDNDVKAHLLSFSVSYLRSLYKPKIKK